LVVCVRGLGRLVERCRGRFVPDRSQFIVAELPRTGRGDVPAPPTYIYDVLLGCEYGDNGV